jgi:hypothetical protein
MKSHAKATMGFCFAKHCNVCVCIGVGYGALQNKDSFLLCIEISYPDGSNGQSKLLNNFFMLKYCGILNFMIFEFSSYFLNYF